jgi:hypothetical protein
MEWSAESSEEKGPDFSTQFSWVRVSGFYKSSEELSGSIRMG